MRTLLFSLIIAFLVTGCNASYHSQRNYPGISGTHVLIYKTKNDYFDHVPVQLSADKQNIISYPHPSDLIIDQKLCLPVKLKKGYLLDNRGIGLNVGFLNISYLAYSKLATAPSVAQLKAWLLDTDPLTELYDLGLRNRYKEPEKDINKIIRRNQLIDYQRLK